MGFMQLDGLGDAKEPELIPDCRTHLRVTNVFPYVKEDTGRHIVRLIHKIEDERFANPANLFHYLAFPKADDEPNVKELMTLNIRRYLHMANVPYEANGFDPMDINGATFDADVVKEETERGFQNAIKLAPLPGEESQKKGKRR